MSGGPPPVPGGRSSEEREAARKAREARRSAAADGESTAAPPAEEPSDAPRRARRPRVGRLAALVVVLVAIVGVVWFALKLFQPFGAEGKGEVRVVIPRGASLGDIADKLEQEGVVDSSTFFSLRARIAGRSGELRPGPYNLQGDMAYTDVLDALEQGVPPNVVRVTIPEGRSRAEIAPTVRRLEGNYLRATRRSRLLKPSNYGAQGATSLEGFLFPSTYELRKGRPVRRLVDEQLRAFKQNFAKVDLAYARRRNLTPYDVLTIASLVERETAVPRERALIASVIYNRLKNDIRLDIDATTRFAVGNWTDPLKVSELQNPSRYNTRVHSGLPPGPIGSPGLASVRAAAHPARTGYIFYVAAVCGNGKHKFAETDSEFQRYVAEYDRARAKRGGKSPTNC
jgi:uncharacterized YceG family protein